MTAPAIQSTSDVSTAPTWAVFTKPWRSPSPAALAELVSRMGFNAVEFPLRPGYQVDLDNLETSLAEVAGVLADHGLRIASVATEPDERRFAACAANGIGLVRIMAPIDPAGFVASKDVIHRRLDELAPLASKHEVRIGVQPHHDCYIADSSELAFLLADYDPDVVTGIWDAAHDGLACKRPINALELLWDRLSMVNFKNALQRPTDRRIDGAVDWDIVFVEGPEGQCSWPEAAHYLRDHSYTGPICLPAEYTDETDLEAKVTADLGYLRSLIDSVPNQNEAPA